MFQDVTNSQTFSIVTLETYSSSFDLFSSLFKFSFLTFSGKNVLNQKTELQRALEKQKERHVVAAQNEMNKDCTSSISSLHGELGKVRISQSRHKIEFYYDISCF